MALDKYRIYKCVAKDFWGKYPRGLFVAPGTERWADITGVADGCDRQDGDGPLVKKIKVGGLYRFKRIYDSRGGSHFHGPYPCKDGKR